MNLPVTIVFHELFSVEGNKVGECYKVFESGNHYYISLHEYYVYTGVIKLEL